MFLADDGHHLIANKPSRFTSMFDWNATEHTFLKKTATPTTIFVKTDYLRRFVSQEFPHITNPFVLITGVADWSPSVNFPHEYEVLVNSPLVIRWYMTNCLCEHPKIVAYPGGLCHNETSDDILRRVRCESVKQSHSRILCIWRDRTFNVCGDQYIVRKRIEEFVKQHPDRFDWVDATLDSESFYRLASSYKFVLCPIGNGVDPCPKAYESMILKSVPIIVNTQNTKTVYADLPALLVDRFEDVLDIDLDAVYEMYRERLSNDCLLDTLSCKYWYDRIIRDAGCSTRTPLE